jgi:hypothetical protein
MGRVLGSCRPGAAAGHAGLLRGFIGVSFSFCGVAWRWVGGGGEPSQSDVDLQIGLDEFWPYGMLSSFMLFNGLVNFILKSNLNSHSQRNPKQTIFSTNTKSDQRIQQETWRHS